MSTFKEFTIDIRSTGVDDAAVAAGDFVMWCNDSDEKSSAIITFMSGQSPFEEANSWLDGTVTIAYNRCSPSYTVSATASGKYPYQVMLGDGDSQKTLEAYIQIGGSIPGLAIPLGSGSFSSD
ncbi:MAG TPA: hypothetical protein VI636_25585 [Candidatus Angelobacter sp.]